MSHRSRPDRAAALTAAGALLLLLSLPSCDRRPQPSGQLPAGAAGSSPASLPGPSAGPVRTAGVVPQGSTSAAAAGSGAASGSASGSASAVPPRPAASGSAAQLPPPPPLRGGPTLEGKAIDVATGAFVSLGAVGLLVRRRDDEILLVRLNDKIAPLSDDGKLYARSKTLVIDHGEGSAAYWVSDGKLLRRVLDRDGKLSSVEVLATDAEDGYVPHGLRNESGATATAQDLVAYVAKKRSVDGDRRAKLWVEGKATHDLTPDGAGASSVFLAASGAGRFAALWLDARSALAPLHAVPIELDGAGEPRMGQESTVWIAPPSELLSQVSAVRVADQGGLVALLALPRNGMDFGLAGVPVAFGAPPLDTVQWLDYPNGLDPAPVVPARFCGLPGVVMVRPTARPIDAPRSLEFATVEASGRVTPRLEIAQASRVDHVSVWVSPRGDGWVAWVGDGRTRVRKLRCGK